MDEAAEGLMALQILGGARPVFFSAYTGQEAGFMYLVAPLIALLGRTIEAVRLPAALAGVALVPAVALLARRAIGPAGALFAAGAVASAPWLQHLNRIGFRANLLPLALALWGWLLLRALSTQRRRDWLACGVLLGTVAYTYLAARFAPLLVLAFLLYLALWQRPLLRRSLPGLGLMLAVAAVLAAPLALHFLRVPSDWGNRLAQVWACSGLAPGACAARLAEHAGRTLAMPAWRGDPKAFYNLDGGPALPLAVGWLCYLGALLALRRWRDPAMALLLLWTLVMALPGIFSSESPSFIRTIGAAPAVMALWALPLARLVDGGRNGADGGRTMAPTLVALASAVLILLMAASTARGYFGRWAVDPERYYDYNGYAIDTARAAGAVPPEVPLAISEEYYRHATYLYLVPRTADARWFDARFGWPFLPPDRAGVIFLPFTTPVERAFVAPVLAGADGRSVLNDAGQYAYTELRLPPGAQPAPPPIGPLGRLGPLDVEGASVDRADDGRLLVALRCRVIAPVDRELRLFVHLLAADGQVIAQQDALGVPSLEWRAGDRFASFHTLAPPPGPLPPGARLVAGLYDVASGERFAASGPAAESAETLTIPLPQQTPQP